jgi:dephospho-CoA kinase
MLKLRKVAVTGGLSCGKSSVCCFLKEFGAYVISSDSIVHQLLASDTTLGQEIVHLLGPDIFVNQRIDRSRIAQIVFERPDLLRALEALIHPAVYRELDREYHKQQNLSQSPSLFVSEIPLLFETGGEKGYDTTVVVMADPEICRQRFEKATGYNQREFNKRMAQQLPLRDKALKADYIIMNHGTLSDLKHATEELYQELVTCHFS